MGGVRGWGGGGQHSVSPATSWHPACCMLHCRLPSAVSGAVGGSRPSGRGVRLRECRLGPLHRIHGSGRRQDRDRRQGLPAAVSAALSPPSCLVLCASAIVVTGYCVPHCTIHCHPYTATLLMLFCRAMVPAGHDHNNDYCGNWKGIELCYGGGAGFHAYVSLCTAHRTVRNALRRVLRSRPRARP